MAEPSPVESNQVAAADDSSWNGYLSGDARSGFGKLRCSAAGVWQVRYRAPPQTDWRDAAIQCNQTRGTDAPWCGRTVWPGLGAAGYCPIRAANRATLRGRVVDDEHTLRESCAAVLRHEGYDVTVCSRGQEALELLKRRAFDVLLVDLYMSQVDGLALLRAA